VLKVDLGSEETLIPFASAYLKKIDLALKRIDVDVPSELRQLNRRS